MLQRVSPFMARSGPTSRYDWSPLIDADRMLLNAASRRMMASINAPRHDGRREMRFAVGGLRGGHLLQTWRRHGLARSWPRDSSTYLRGRGGVNFPGQISFFRVPRVVTSRSTGFEHRSGGGGRVPVPLRRDLALALQLGGDLAQRWPWALVAQRLDAGNEAQTALALDVGLAPLSLANDFTLAVACCLELGDHNLPPKVALAVAVHSTGQRAMTRAKGAREGSESG